MEMMRCIYHYIFDFYFPLLSVLAIYSGILILKKGVIE
ncbi:hypothetical protein CU008_2523 [Enterococcus faecium]|nr:hypothetical protein [Enterococcus faecium]